MGRITRAARIRQAPELPDRASRVAVIATQLGGAKGDEDLPTLVGEQSSGHLDADRAMLLEAAESVPANQRPAARALARTAPHAPGVPCRWIDWPDLDVDRERQSWEDDAAVAALRVRLETAKAVVDDGGGDV